MTFGTCRYCGQVVNLDYEEETQAEADIAASEKCECYDARHERNLRKQITAAQNRIRKIFGDDAAKLGFSPIAAEEPLQLLNAIAELICWQRLHGTKRAANRSTGKLPLS